MTESFLIRRATSEDAEAIVQTIANGFEPELLAAMPYGSSGAARYVAANLSLPAGLSDRRYWVAERDHKIAGCAELRPAGRDLFLSYIAVREGERGAGIASKLLAAALSDASDLGGMMKLDVFAHNDRAATWYERLGFRDESAGEWFVLTPDAGECPVAATIINYPQAEAVHAAYGFSALEIVVANQTFQVGRLSSRYYRITSRDALLNTALGESLRRLDTNRELLAVLPRNTLPSSLKTHARRLAETRRLAVSLESLRGKLLTASAARRQLFSSRGVP